MCITWSNFVRYCINYCRIWGRISIRCWIHKRHLTGEIWGVFCRYFFRKLTTLYEHRIVLVMFFPFSVAMRVPVPIATLTSLSQSAHLDPAKPMAVWYVVRYSSQNQRGCKVTNDKFNTFELRQKNSPFCRWQFQMHILEGKLHNFQ